MECGDTRLAFKTAWRKLKECGEPPNFGLQGAWAPDTDGCLVLQDEMPVHPGPPQTIAGFYQQQRSKRVVLVVKERAATTYAMWRPNSRAKPERRRLAHNQVRNAGAAWPLLCCTVLILHATDEQILHRLRRFTVLSETSSRVQWVRGARLQCGNALHPLRHVSRAELRRASADQRVAKASCVLDRAVPSHHRPSAGLLASDQRMCRCALVPLSVGSKPRLNRVRFQTANSPGAER